MNRVKIVKSDITALDIEAIVNAANTSLLGGGGVDGAIHQAAGKMLLEECKGLHGCGVGCAKITKGYNLKAQWVIHTVGPVWHGGDKDEEEVLAQCYRSVFNIISRYDIKAVAFPSISTGAYCFPIERAASVALREIKTFLDKTPNFKKIVITCFDQDTYQTYLKAYQEYNAYF